MESHSRDVLTCRIAVLSLAAVELARALPPFEAARAGHAIRRQMIEQVCDGTLSSDAADSIAEDLKPLLGALVRR